MSYTERFEALVLGSGAGGKLLAWHLARSGRRTAVVERQWIGGSCPNVNCMPSKNEIWSANVAYVASHAAVQTAMLAELPYPKLRDAILAHLTMAEGLGFLLSN